MTVPATPRRAGPYTGNGTTLTFPFSFKVFSAADLRVDLATDAGVESLGVLNDTFTVSLNADQTATPGGTVSYAVSGVATALPTGYSLAITGARALAQTVTLPTGGAYHASSVEAALDSLQMQIQQVDEGVGRALTLSPLAPSGTSTTLPAPGSNKLIGWNEAATGLQNMDPGVLATIVAFGSAAADQFTGDGTTTTFTLTATPGALNNLDISIGGATQRPGVDYLWSSGTTLTFTSAPPSGVPILVRYMQGLPAPEVALRSDLANPAAGYGAWLVGFTPTATAAAARTVQQALDDRCSITDFMSQAQLANYRAKSGSVDISDAIQAAVNSGYSWIDYPDGKGLVSNPVYLTSFQTHYGPGCELTSSGTIFTHSTVQQFITIDGIRFSGTGNAFYQPNGNIYTVNLIVRNCLFSCTLTECLYCTPIMSHVHNCHFGTNSGTVNAAHRHIYWKANQPSGTAVNLNKIENNRFNLSKAAHAIYLEYGSNNTFERNDIESNSNSVSPVRLNAVGITTFKGNWWESNTGARQVMADISGNAGVTLYNNRGINVDGDYFVMLMADNVSAFDLDAGSLNLRVQGTSFYTNRSPVYVTTSTAGNNGGVTEWNGNTNYGNTVTFTGLYNFGSLALSGTLAVGTTSASVATMVVRPSGGTVPLRIQNAGDTISLLSVGNTGQISTGNDAASPFNNLTATAANLVVLSNGVLQRSTSSARYKTAIHPATHGLAEVMKLRPVTYRANNQTVEIDGETVTQRSDEGFGPVIGGLIAEEVHAVGLTEFVAYDEIGRPDALHYSHMVSLLVRAVQELQEQIDQLKGRP